MVGKIADAIIEGKTESESRTTERPIVRAPRAGTRASEDMPSRRTTHSRRRSFAIRTQPNPTR